jgi:hypothetical protein
MRVSTRRKSYVQKLSLAEEKRNRVKHGRAQASDRSCNQEGVEDKVGNDKKTANEERIEKRHNTAPKQCTKRPT